MRDILLVVFFFYGGKLSHIDHDYPSVDVCRQAAATIMRAAGPLHMAGIRYVCIDQRTGKELDSGSPRT